jgi:hypothetical protein
MNPGRYLALLVLAATVHAASHAQSGTALADGKAFAEKIVPKTKDQIVDPTGVNATTWAAGKAAMPTTTPTQLGAFSAPLTSSPLYATSGAQGALSGLGNARMTSCRTYTPTGDPIADQECAAVKFMDKDCVSLNSSQFNVLGAAGVSTGMGIDCSDTYGAGQAAFGYANAVTTTDPIFETTKTAQRDASSSVTQQCVPVTVVTKPAEYETNNCSKTVVTDSHVCTQDLSVAVTTRYTAADLRYSCASGSLSGTSCVDSSSVPASYTYSCSSGTLSGDQCTTSASTPATSTTSCPAGTSLDGSGMCVGQTATPATPIYSCPNGGSVSGSDCVNPVLFTYDLCPPGWVHTISPGGGANLCLDGKGGQMYPGGYIHCSNGATPVNGSCGYTTVGTATLNWQCGSGTLSGDKCLTNTTTSPTTGLSCSAGQLSGNNCVTTSSTPATKNYYCPAGAVLNGTTCTTTTSTSATSYYVCPGGGTLVGNQCKSVLVETRWIDNCKAYEQSAGITLGAPK